MSKFVGYPYIRDEYVPEMEAKFEAIDVVRAEETLPVAQLNIRSELLVLNVNGALNGAKEGGFPTPEITTPNSAPELTAEVS